MSLFRYAMNWFSLLGWSGVAIKTAIAFQTNQAASTTLLQTVLGLEVLCASETLQIAMGILRGDLALSFVVHYTRFMMLFIAMPHSAVNATVVKYILMAWSLTEVFRYPMVLFPKSKLLKTVRYAAPLITFPMGAGTEAYAAYLVLIKTDNNIFLKGLLGLIVLTNVVGGIVWYPGMIKKVIRSLSDKTKKMK